VTNPYAIHLPPKACRQRCAEVMATRGQALPSASVTDLMM